MAEQAEVPLRLGRLRSLPLHALRLGGIPTTAAAVVLSVSGQLLPALACAVWAASVYIERTWGLERR